MEGAAVLGKIILGKIAEQPLVKNSIHTTWTGTKFTLICFGTSLYHRFTLCFFGENDISSHSAEDTGLDVFTTYPKRTLHRTEKVKRKGTEHAVDSPGAHFSFVFFARFF